MVEEQDRRERRGKQTTLNWITGAGFPILVLFIVGIGSIVWDMKSTVDKAKELEIEMFELERELKKNLDRLEDELKKALQGHKGVIFGLIGKGDKTVHDNRAEIFGVKSEVDILLVRIEKVFDRLWDLQRMKRGGERF